jgi:hypothetical protein
VTPRDACARDYRQACREWAAAAEWLHTKRLDLAGVEQVLDCMWAAYQRADAAVSRAASIEQQQRHRPTHL